MGVPVMSVIINNFNYAPYLGTAIQSALDQVDVAAEVIVVDDGSTDGSRRVIDGFGDRIVPVLRGNGGQAAAINSGVARSRGDILCFLDADDWWQPTKLSAVRDAFAAAPEAGLVYHRLQPKLSNGEDVYRAIPRSLCAGDLAPGMAASGGRWPFPMTSAVSVRRSLWDRIGDIPEDFRISADAWLVGIYPFLAPVVALPQALGLYRIHENQWFRTEDDAAMLRKRAAHWQRTITLSNAFLRERDLPWRLDPADHLPLQLVLAQLDGASWGRRAALLWQGMNDPGEPDPVRRLRDAVRAVRRLRAVGMGQTSGIGAR